MKVIVEYDHNPADLTAIYLAWTTANQPSDSEWRPALRDTINGRKVVWARFPLSRRGALWLRDRNGERRVKELER
jgi:hypothetical protein